ncbi:MAG: hypothetical protein K2Q03_04230 [Sphingobacteriaceae bacterium]|nr:hypothetical protein [Sphingobacteriaceae bacterium]
MIKNKSKEKLAMFLSSFLLSDEESQEKQQTPTFKPEAAEEDTIGGIDLAMAVTGWSAATIYSKTAPSSSSTIPVMALSRKHLRFSKKALIHWMQNGGDKRKEGK